VPSTLGVTPPAESYRPPAVTRSAEAGHARMTPLMRFVAPPALSTRRVHSTQACLTWYVPPSGFRTLLTVCSSNGLPGLVSCRSAHGVPALQSFSLARSRDASRRPDAFLPFARADRPGRGPRARLATEASFTRHLKLLRGAASGPFTTEATACSTGSTSRLCSPGRVRCAGPRLSACAAPDALLGLLPRPYSRSSPRDGVATDAPPTSTAVRRTCGHSHRLAARLRLRGGLTATGMAVLRKARHARSRWFHLIDVLLDLGAVPPWLMGSPREPSARRRVSGALFGQ